VPYRISYIDTSMSADDQQMDGRLRSEEFATEPAALTRARPFGRAGMRSCAGWGQKCPADETYPNCVNGLPYLRDKDSLPTDSVQFALTETRSSILDTTEPIPESVHQRIIAQDVE